MTFAVTNFAGRGVTVAAATRSGKPCRGDEIPAAVFTLTAEVRCPPAIPLTTGEFVSAELSSREAAAGLEPTAEVRSTPVVELLPTGGFEDPGVSSREGAAVPPVSLLMGTENVCATATGSDRKTEIVI